MEMASELSKIVVVEDNASLRRAIKRILRAGGFAPVLFASAEAALEADAAAAGMSGSKLYGRLARHGKEMSVVFISASDEEVVRAEAEKLAGAGSYLPKPFSGRELLDAVTRALARH
jgi:FixJ family two-component response regulator